MGSKDEICDGDDRQDKRGCPRQELLDAIAPPPGDGGQEEQGEKTADGGIDEAYSGQRSWGKRQIGVEKEELIGGVRSG